jgi:hypothetical protein
VDPESINDEGIGGGSVRVAAEVVDVKHELHWVLRGPARCVLSVGRRCRR